MLARVVCPSVLAIRKIILMVDIFELRHLKAHAYICHISN
uniref:Uncharacterized protein n=1 Tax=Arundo donax TaxID=35708 RepID=A0A0A9H092_ARUDO